MDKPMSSSAVAAGLGMSVRWVEAQIASGALPAYAWDTGTRRVFRIEPADYVQFRERHLHLVSDLPPYSERVDEEARNG